MSDVLGLFGGTFDPVHYGHLRAALGVQRALGMREVRLVPGRDPPHRPPPGANAAARLAMLKLAVPEFPSLAVDDRELQRTGKSFTIDTLESLRQELPQRPLALIVGVDAFAGFPSWHRWTAIFDTAHVVVTTRPGTSIDDALDGSLADQWRKRHTVDRTALETPRGGAIFWVELPPQPISATAIRAALAAGDYAQIRGLLPAAVLTYIQRHQLYHET